jgi:4a-hydroxytetrahydrobiopterin dehydratase
MESLAKMKCIPCRGGVPTLTEKEIADLNPEVPQWEILEHNGVKRLKRRFEFKNFAEALAFTNQIGEIAEEQDHHPVLVTEWGKVTVTWWTHEIEGLHRNDFIMAAKTDSQYEAGK